MRKAKNSSLGAGEAGQQGHVGYPRDHLCDPARQGSTCVKARAVSGSPPALFACNYMGEQAAIPPEASQV